MLLISTSTAQPVVVYGANLGLFPVTLTGHRQRVFENEVLRKMFGSQTKDQENGENCVMRSFEMCTPRQVLSGRSKKDNGIVPGVLHV
jgi:hypothetical protein